MTDWPSEFRELRRAMGWTQPELAKRLRVDRLKVSRLENGHRTPHPQVQARFDRLLRRLGRPRVGVESQ